MDGPSMTSPSCHISHPRSCSNLGSANYNHTPTSPLLHQPQLLNTRQLDFPPETPQQQLEKHLENERKPKGIHNNTPHHVLPPPPPPPPPPPHQTAILNPPANPLAATPPRRRTNRIRASPTHRLGAPSRSSSKEKKNLT